MKALYQSTMLIVLATGTSLCMENDSKAKQQEKPDFLSSFLNGAFAGSAEVICNNPLIVLKNELILRTQKSARTSAEPLSAHNGFKEKIQKYYRGSGTGVLFMAPITAMQNSIALALSKLLQGTGELTLTQKTLAAFLAGVSSALLGSPADLLVLQRGMPDNQREQFLQTLKRIYAAQGLSAFYRGVSSTGLRDGIFTAAYKTGGSALQSYCPLNTGNAELDRGLSNSASGIIAALLSHPADVISARLKSDLNKTIYKNSPQTARSLIEQEGVKALFKGVVPRGSRILLAIPLLNALTEKEAGTKLLTHIEKLFK